ncbi:BnaCnng53940D [Brassica napus]|uniref:BnaCnng53940D protein n=1 Tax=Brassica napus TaxID=3708 RepID=A0A078JN85_BRANA|nr:BnaCnng53940D [Brassica napus]
MCSLSFSFSFLFVYIHTNHIVSCLSLFIYTICIEDVSMGNCLGHNNDLSGKEKDNLETERPVESFEEGEMSNSKEEERESSTERESNVVRIKVVVTKEELRQILGHTKVAETSPGLMKKTKN